MYSIRYSVITARPANFHRNAIMVLFNIFPQVLSWVFVSQPSYVSTIQTCVECMTIKIEFGHQVGLMSFRQCLKARNPQQRYLSQVWQRTGGLDLLASLPLTRKQCKDAPWLSQLGSRLHLRPWTRQDADLLLHRQPGFLIRSLVLTESSKAVTNCSTSTSWTANWDWQGSS